MMMMMMMMMMMTMTIMYIFRVYMSCIYVAVNVVVAVDPVAVCGYVN